MSPPQLRTWFLLIQTENGENWQQNLTFSVYLLSKILIVE